MRYPKFLKDNGTIGVCAPSLGTVIEPYLSRLNNSIKNFEAKGHKVLLTNSVRSNTKMASASPETRAEEFMQVYKNEDVNVIISEAGGEVMCQMLSYLNFDEIKELEPKLFQGYSDNTCLTFLLTTLCDVASIYGVCFPEFGMKKWHSTIKDSYALLKGENFTFKNLKKYEIESKKKIPGNELAGYNLTEKSKSINLSKDDDFKIKGRVLTVCMDVLTMICFTKFYRVKEFIDKYKDDGIIWFLESCDLTIAGQLRALWQFKNAGWFKHVKAIFIGRPNNKEEFFDMDYKEANYQELQSLNVPVIIDADFGHVGPVIPIFSGAIADVNYKKGKYEIEYILK